MWLTGRLAPDFKTIADFRRDNGPAIRNVCRRFVELCRGLKLLSSDMVAIDGSQFKAVNSRDRNNAEPGDILACVVATAQTSVWGRWPRFTSALSAFYIGSSICRTNERQS